MKSKKIFFWYSALAWRGGQYDLCSVRDWRKEGAGWPSSLTGSAVARSSGRDEAAMKRVGRCIVGCSRRTFQTVK